MHKKPHAKTVTLETALKDYFKDYVDFPKPGIIFKDLCPILEEPRLFSRLVREICRQAEECSASKIVGIESRGFLVGLPVAFELGLPFIPARKKGKLPGAVYRQDYALEYGTDSIEVQKERVQNGDRFLVVDDVIATGGTAVAAARCIEAGGAEVAGFTFVLEIEYLQGVQNLNSQFPNAPVWSLVKSP